MAACSSLLFFACAAWGHPAGFTSINRYLGLRCEADGLLRIRYLLDFAELPSYAEFEELDADHDATVTPGEQRAYLDHRLPPLVDAWVVLVNGAKATLRITGSVLEVRQGEQGMSTLRIAAEVEASRTLAPQLGAQETRVYVRDVGFADRSGWRELSADDSPQAVVVAGTKQPSSTALAYMSAATPRPPRRDEAEFTFRPATPAPVTGQPESAPQRPVVDARLARLSVAMTRASGSWLFSAVALALAAALGAIHALSPGHGKSLAAAYLVGRRARPSYALAFGLSVTVAHTTVVFLVGILAVAIERAISSDRFLRGLELASAVMVLVLGATQLSHRWHEATRGSHEGHHDRPHDEPRAGDMRAVIALGTASGLTPCPSALAVLLAAIALHRYGFALLLVLAFSFGVASTLTAAGLLVLLARSLLDRVSVARPFIRWLPVVSSAGVTAIGILLCASACSSAAP